MLRAAPGAEFESYTSGFATGLAGTLGVRLRDGQGADAIARTTAGIHEDIAGSGIYRVTLTAPAAPGEYWLVFDNGSGVYSVPEELTVSRSPLAAGEPSGRELCTLDDVFGYVPGYDPDDAENAPTNAKLGDLITSESRTIHGYGREFVAIAAADPRVFDITAGICQRRSLPIGDATSISSVELFDFDGSTSLGVVASSLYVLKPRTREEWEPYTRLSFPYRPAGSPLLLAPGRTLVLSGAWGFPQIPPDIRQACAALVIVRYLTDVAASGTAFAEAIADDISVAGLLKSALSKVEAYAAGPFA